MAEDKHRDWVDTIAKLLLPMVIFLAGLVFSYQKDRNDRANQQFERESGILRLTASPNEKEKLLGLKLIEIQLREGKFSPDLVEAVYGASFGRSTDASTILAQNVLVEAVKQNPDIGKQISFARKSASSTVYLQIAREDQRALAGAIKQNLETNGFVVPEIELVLSGTANTYVRYLSADDKVNADKILDIVSKMGIRVQEQDFTPASQGKAPAGQLEVWIGEKQGPLLSATLQP